MKNKIYIAILISLFAHCCLLALLIYLGRPQEMPLGDGLVTVDMIGEENGSADNLETNSPLPEGERVRERVTIDNTNNSAGSGSGGSYGIKTGNPILAQIRKKIERAKYYPLMAKRQNLEGRPEVAFKLNEDGSISSLSITKSSGIQMLDDAALETIKRASPFPYYEGEIRLAVKYAIE